MKKLIATLFLLLLSVPAFTAPAESPLRLGVLAFRPKAQAMQQWQPLARHIEKSLGRRVQLTVYNYPDLNAAVQQKAVDIVLTNPGHYVLLRRRFDISAPLATQITRTGKYELSSFGGVIFTRADETAINSLADLSGKLIAATDIDSLGGYQMQAFELLEAGLPLPSKSTLIDTGMPHDRVAEAVLAGRADAGFVRSGVLESLVIENKLDLARIKILHQQNQPTFPYIVSTRLYPEWPVAVMPQVDEKIARRLTVALLSLSSSSAAAQAAGISGFATPSDYSGVEDVLRKLRIPPFDNVPEFTLTDLWKKYSDRILAFLIFLLVIFSAMGAGLLVQNRREKHTQQRFITLFEYSPEPMWIIVNDYIIDCNKAVLAIFGVDNKSSLLNHRPGDFTPEVQPDGENSRVKIARLINAAEAGQAQRFEWVLLKADASRLNVVISLTHIKLSGQSAVLAVGHDITERKKAEMRERHRNHVLEMLTTKTSLAKVLDTIASDMEAINPTLKCNILLLDDDGKHLRHGAAPSFPAFFNQALDGLAIGPGVAACGTAAYTGERIIIEDIETHPYWTPFIELARKAELGACWSQPIRSAQGKVLGTVALYHRHAYKPTPGDLQLIEDEAILAALAIEQTKAEEKLQLAAIVFEHAREGIMITDPTGNIIEINDTFTLITGYSRQEALGQNPRLLQSGQHGPEYFAEMWRALTQGNHWSGETWNRRKNGELFAVMQSISVVRNSDGNTQNYVSMFVDITPMKHHQQQLEHIAHYDSLTNLPNRVLLADRLQHAMAQSQRRNLSLAVVYLDLDGFKSVNDQHGHDIGDALLIALSVRMKAALRDGDTLARIGGDEFVAVLVDLERNQDWEPVLARLLQAAADQVIMGKILLQVSASIGVTLYPQDKMDADQLMRHADQAMYIAKQSGKNRYHLFDVDRDAAVQTQHETLERIRLAFDKREFILYYQPKVNMKTGLVIGAEALIRWQHPERGLLTPVAFLTKIENFPISLEVGEWVIDSALKKLSQWHAEGLNITVSVNISAHQLQQADFLSKLAKQLADYPDIQPGYLELEILETSALEDISHVSSVMHACRELGVRFALDDFGTGYSSLTYLKRLPADILKIDRSFVSDMFDNPNDLAIVEGVVGLASAFQREVIAEGVETVVHGQLLLSLGCELAQGYGIAWPMPAAEFHPWAQTWRPDSTWTAWRNHPYTRDDISVVQAEVEHRHWMYNMDAYLHGKLETPPPLDIQQCHFGLWLETEGRTRYRDHPYFSAVLDLHERVHQMGHALVDLHTHGKNAAARSRLKELYNLRDELISKLKILAIRTELNVQPGDTG
jgi:diguanylate cyclase (GGDEF)-like protein/PAS domain S-box-containing protein